MDDFFCKNFILLFCSLKALAAEVTSAFSRRLAPLNMVVKELTGDMQLTKTELEETQVSFKLIRYA